jgi:hypothetical protein
MQPQHQQQRNQMPVQQNMQQNRNEPTRSSGPAGQAPSASFNTGTDGEPAPYLMNEMNGCLSDKFSFLETDKPLLHNYAFLKEEKEAISNHLNKKHMQNSMTNRQARPKKLPNAKYDAFLSNRNADPYITQNQGRR